MADFTQSIVIRAVDNVTSTLSGVMAKLGLLGSMTGEVDAAFAEVSRTSVALTSRLKYMGLAAAGVATAVFWMAYRTSDAAESLDNLSQKTGVSVEELQKLNYVADQANVGAESLAMGFRFLNRAIADASTTTDSEAASAFAALNIDLKDTQGNVKSTEDVFYELSDAFENADDGPRKVQTAIKLLGRAGEGLIPILNQGSEALRKQGDRFAKYNNLLTKDGIKAIKDFNDEVDNLKYSFTGIGSIIAQTLIPYIQPLVTQFADWVANNRELIKTKLEEWIQKLVTGFQQLVPKLEAFWEKVKKVWDAVGGFQGILKGLAIFLAADMAIAITNFGIALAGLSKALLMTPLGLVVTTLASIVGLVVYLNNTFPELGKTITGTIDIMIEKFTSFFQGIWDGIRSLLEAMDLIDKKKNEQKNPKGKYQQTIDPATGKVVSRQFVPDDPNQSSVDLAEGQLAPTSTGPVTSAVNMLSDFTKAQKPMEINLKLDTENTVKYADIDAPLATNVTVNSGPMVSYA